MSTGIKKKNAPQVFTATDHDGRRLAVSATDVLRLMQAHLTQSGLHATAATLRVESGVGLAAPLHHSWLEWAVSGQWNLILQSLSTLDRAKYQDDDDDNRYQELWAEVHEMAVLEVAAAGDVELAYALLRLAAPDLAAVTIHDARTDQRFTRARRVELALEDLVQQQHQRQRQEQSKYVSDNSSSSSILPADFYGPSGATRESRRRDIGQRLAEALPVQPPDRLVTLLQQAVQYQTFTGVLPQVQQVWDTEGNDDEAQADGELSSSKPKKKKRKVFDLVLGSVQQSTSSSSGGMDRRRRESTSWHKPLATIKFGKHAVCQAAVFTPNGQHLVTGSSDGMMEVWKTVDYTLQTDLPYQRQDDDGDDNDHAGLGHATAVMALTVAADGTLLASGSSEGEITVWRIDTGKALRQFAMGNPVTCLAFTPDGSRLLASGGVYCREYGLRTGKCLREYSQGEVALTACGFNVFSSNEQLRVWTAATDGCIRWYQASTASFLAAWRPPASKSLVEGASVVSEGNAEGLATSPPLVAVLVVTLSSSTGFVLVPRGPQACLVNEEGEVVRVFRDRQVSSKSEGSAFCAATLSPGQEWLYAMRENGSCAVFDTATGELEKNVDDVAKDTAAKTREGALVEISSLIPHPFKAHVACFSNDKRQKKGQLVVWK